MIEHPRTLADRHDEDGASAVEYGLLVAAIAAIIVLLVFALGGMMKGAFDTTCAAMEGEVSTAETCS